VAEKPGAGSAAPGPRDRGAQLAAAQKDVGELMQLLAAAEVVTSVTGQPLAALATGATNRKRSGSASKRGRTSAAASKPKQPAPLLEAALCELRERDPVSFSQRIEELGYLVNVWIAGGEHEGRRPRPVEALEAVMKTCEAGLRKHVTSKSAKRQAFSVVRDISADRLFREGFAGSDRPRSRLPPVPFRSI
jgi:hypothetical protein